MPQAVMTQHQPSITEWLEKIGKKEQSLKLRQEDNTKSNRLELLYQIGGISYERPEKFQASELVMMSARFQAVLLEKGDELCAIRVIPKKSGLPKYRNRGLTLRETYKNWFLKLPIEFADYEAHVCPHSETLLWSTIFAVKKEGVFGEIVEGLHAQLTQGETHHPVYRFYYDFQQWHWNKRHSQAEQQMKHTLELLHWDVVRQEQLSAQLPVEWAADHLIGYFETVIWPDGTIRFIDFNRVLTDLIGAAPIPKSDTTPQMIRGSVAHPGRVEGRAVVINHNNVLASEFAENSVLVCDNTDVRYLPLMRKAVGIITNRGGILSHAAIIARELGKPCIIGTQNATAQLQTGDYLLLDADRGNVIRLQK